MNIDNILISNMVIMCVFPCQLPLTPNPRETDDGFRRAKNDEVGRHTNLLDPLNNLSGISTHFWSTIILW